MLLSITLSDRHLIPCLLVLAPHYHIGFFCALIHADKALASGLPLPLIVPENYFSSGLSVLKSGTIDFVFTDFCNLLVSWDDY